MSRAVQVDGREGASVAVDDRGLAYGDGVFETIATQAGEPVWWEAHVRRLQRGCAALGIEAPDGRDLLDEARALAGESRRGVLKLVVTRGRGPRGYAAPPSPTPTRILSFEDWAGPDAALAVRGATLRWCDTTLARQPRLAGLKHLNRLEQVLARAEWRDPDIDEGLVCDTDGRVTSAVAANLFVVRDGRLSTPRLDACGVAGVARGWVMAQAVVDEAALDRQAVESADELFLTSSLRGILPVARLAGRTWEVGPMTRALQRDLWQAEPGLRPDGVGA